MSYTNFKVSGLTAYVEESKDLILKNLVFGKGSRERMSIQTGVKYKERIHILNLAPVFGSALDCGFTGAGEAELTERLIEAAALKINMEICPENLIGKYAEYLVRLNANENDLPFEQYIIDGIVSEVNKNIEKMIWQGDKSQTTDAVLKWIDGLIEIASDSVSGSTGVIGESIASGSTAYAGLLQVYASIPEDALERGAEIYVSPAIFRSYMQDMVALNFYHYNPGNENLEEFALPGTNVKVVKVAGLAGCLKVLATFPKNLYYGTDMENDAEDVKVWFSDDDQVWKVLAKWSSGVQIAFLDQCVLGTFAATPAATTGIAGGVTALAPLAALAGAYDADNELINVKDNA